MHALFDMEAIIAKTLLEESVEYSSLWTTRLVKLPRAPARQTPTQNLCCTESRLAKRPDPMGVKEVRNFVRRNVNHSDPFYEYTNVDIQQVKKRKT